MASDVPTLEEMVHAFMNSRQIITGLIIIVLIISIVYVVILITQNQNNNSRDTTPPVVTIINPDEDAVLAGIVSINFNATDANPIVEYEIRIDSIVRASDTNFEWDTKLETNGVHNIVCRARDNSSNWGEDSISVVIDNVVDNNIPLLNFTGTIKVMTYNIEESGANPDWMNVVKEENPDIMILVEVGTWDDSSDLVLRNSIEELNNYFVDEAPYSGEVTQGISYSTSGEAILSRFSILDFNQIGIVPLDNGTNYDVTHDFIHATVNVNGTNVHLVGAHLKAMGGETNEDRREWETEGIINYMDNLGEVPVMYMGDLNSFSPYDTGDLAPNGDLGYGPLTMMLDPDDPTYGQYASEIHNFTDVFRTLNPTNPGYTYGHQNPTYTSRIDFLLVNDYFLDKLINSTCGDTAHADTGSDHYSVDIFLGWNSTGINDTIAPADVTGLKVDANYTMGIDLSWNANNETDLYRYVVYRDSVQIAEVAESYYNDTGLSSNTTYTYEVSAKDLYGNEGNKSLAVNATTLDMSSLESIVINEFLPDAFTIYTEEWIELFNPSAEAVDLAGYILDDLVAGGGSPFTIPGGSIIATGGFLVFNQSTVGFALNNDGDTVNLIKPDGVTVQDSYTYDSSSDDVSYGRQVDGGVVWTTFVNPTPGASNLGGTLYRVVIPPSTGYLFEMFYIVKLW